MGKIVSVERDGTSSRVKLGQRLAASSWNKIFNETSLSGSREAFAQAFTTLARQDA